MLLLTDNFKELCKQSTVYLDTNSFIYAAENSDLNQLYIELANKYNTAFITLNSVEFEFTRGSRNLQQLTDKRNFVRGIAKILNVNRLLDNERNDVFSVAMSLTLSSKDSQYTDFLLAVALHAYNSTITKQYVLSADARAFPLDLFDVCGAVTFDIKKLGPIHMNLYALDEKKYAAILKAIK